MILQRKKMTCLKQVEQIFPWINSQKELLNLNYLDNKIREADLQKQTQKRNLYREFLEESLKPGGKRFHQKRESTKKSFHLKRECPLIHIPTNELIQKSIIKPLPENLVDELQRRKESMKCILLRKGVDKKEINDILTAYEEDTKRYMGVSEDL